MMMMRKTGQEGPRESKVESKHSYIFHAGVNESIWGRVIQFALIVFNSAQQMCLSKINHLHLVENTHTTKHTHEDNAWVLHAFIIEYGFCAALPVAAGAAVLVVAVLVLTLSVQVGRSTIDGQLATGRRLKARNLFSFL